MQRVSRRGWPRLAAGASLVALGAWALQVGAIGWGTAMARRVAGAGPVGFGAAYVAAVVLMLPTWPLTMLAGTLFGVIGGGTTAWVSANLGSALTFGIARRWGRQWMTQCLPRSPRWAAIDRAVARGGWRAVALLRLSPLVPFNLQNYGYGLTAIAFVPCVAAGAVAMIPGTVLYASIGALGRPRSWSAVEAAYFVAGLCATALAAGLLARLARRELARMDAPATGPVSPPEARDFVEPEPRAL